MPEPSKEAVEKMANKLSYRVWSSVSEDEKKKWRRSARYVLSLLGPAQETLESCQAWILLGNHDEAPGWIEAMDKAQAALAALKEAIG